MWVFKAASNSSYITTKKKKPYPKLYEGQYDDNMCLLTACLPFSLSPERHLGGSVSKGGF